MIRQVLLVLALIALALPAQAADPAAWRGVKVLPKANCVVKVGNETIDRLKLSIPYVVQDVKAEWLWIGDSRKGWVQRSQVVTMDEAPAYYTRLINSNQDKAWAYLHRAVAWHEKRELDLAIADYGERLRLEPTAEAYNNRGTVWISKKEYDKAIIDYNQAIRLDPSHVMAYVGRGSAWLHMKDYDKAIADCNQAIRLDQNYALAYYNRGLAWAGKKEYDKAIADCNQAIHLDPNFALAYYNIACCYSLQHQTDPAIDNLRHCLKLGYSNRNHLKSDSDLDSIRSDPRYQELIRQYAK